VLASPLLYFGWKVQRRFAAHAAYEEAERKANELSADELAALRKRLPEVSAMLDATAPAFAAATTPAVIAALVPTGGQCLAGLVPPTLRTIDANAARGGFADDAGNVYVRVVTSARSTLSWVADRIEKDEVKQPDRQQVERVARDVGPTVWVVGKEVPAFVSVGPGAVSYTPGRVHGQALVYDHRAGRIVCAGPIDVENGPSIDISYSYMKDNFLDQDRKAHEAATAILAKDLELRVRREVAMKVVAVGPGREAAQAPAPAQ
jgi:hypothetical protein